MMSKHLEITWQAKPEKEDYTGAESYLGLLYGSKAVKAIVSELETAPTIRFKSKDIFRASGLSLLGISNTHVEKDRKKIVAGKPLSPILLVRDKRNRKVIIADGYHRLCAVYSYDDDALIPSKIV
jgi:hypothetical protein